MAIISRLVWPKQERNRKIMSGLARSGAKGKLLQLQHGKTYYELDEKSDSPLLVCISGWSTASYVWDPLKPLLRAKGYRLLTYDLYGRGYSDRPEVAHTAALFTDQLSQLLNQLKLPTNNLNVVGYSMGGAIAASFASQRLQDMERLLLIAPAGMEVRAPTARRIARRNPRLFDPHILTLLPLALRIQFRSAAADFKDNPMVAAVEQKQRRELEYRGYIPALASSLHGILASKMENEHRAIARSGLPVRAIFGSKDKTIPSPDAKKLFDRWHSEEMSREIQGVGHALTYTHPERVMQEVDDFI